MNIETKQVLKDIGEQLDANIFPSVINGGIVVPSVQSSPLFKLGEVKNYVSQRQSQQQGQRGSESESRQRDTGGQGATNRARSPGNPPSLICSDLQEQYESELDDLHKAYPNTKVWHQPEGVWLLTYSTLLEGNTQSAAFLMCIPYSKFSIARSWGFWNGLMWIGPRHTNFPDGSICAFEPKDGTWKIGDSLIKLLDIYSLWATRHLYLKEFNYWPGFQSVHLALERILELKDDEFCGCDNFNKKYKNCCKPTDYKNNSILRNINFLVNGNNGKRLPPYSIMRFMHSGGELPKIKKIIMSDLLN